MLPPRPLTDIDLKSFGKEIPFFRGVFMRNNLPSTGPLVNESAIVNLDDRNGRGTHWVAYKKRGPSVKYFDSFGDLPPPRELVKYLLQGPSSAQNILYNNERKQQFNTVWCGHLCLKFLFKR